MLALAGRSTQLPVELVEWPDQDGLRKALANAGVPRVLLVEPSVEPPESLGIDEGWVPADASDQEIDDCGRQVLQRLVHAGGIVAIDERIWSVPGHVFQLSPLLARLFTELVADRGTTLTYVRLIEAGWNGRTITHGALDIAMQRLRDQLVGTGLCIRSVRGIGFLLA